MLSAKDAAIVYETLLSSPGMGDPVKVDLKLPRKNVLILTELITLGLSVRKEKGAGRIVETITDETAQELEGLTRSILSKSGLSEMQERLEHLFPQ